VGTSTSFMSINMISAAGLDVLIRASSDWVGLESTFRLLVLYK
jgi:hypothetical protein